MVSKTKKDDMDFFYLDSDKKKKTKQNKKENTKKTSPKTVTTKKKTVQKKDNEIFNIDNEIVIGITPKKATKKPNNGQPVKKTTNKKKPEKQNIIVKNKIAIIKYLVIFILILAAIVLFFLSPIFNIKVINVNNNLKIPSEEIINLSRILIGENSFKISKSKTIKNIKENPYIESVTITRKLPDTIEIGIVEREATYMIEFANGFVYVNNQGYMLEISEEKLELPILIDIVTPVEAIAAGNRLVKEDLLKLEDVIKIVNAAKSVEINTKITKISIKEFTLFLENDGKTAYIGDTSNINTKMLYLKDILQKEEGKTGEVFLNKDINKYNVFFRENVR